MRKRTCPQCGAELQQGYYENIPAAVCPRCDIGFPEAE